MSEVQEFEEGTEGECEGNFPGCEWVGSYRLDPCAADLLDEKSWMFLCAVCYQERCWEV